MKKIFLPLIFTTLLFAEEPAYSLAIQELLGLAFMGIFLYIAVRLYSIMKKQEEIEGDNKS
jgi:hypothetical protein